MTNDFTLQTDDLSELLHILTVKMMFHHLHISSQFQPKHLWTWIDRNKISSTEYLYKSYDLIIDSWTKFKCTGHGAIELGTLRHLPNHLIEQQIFGLESRIISHHEVFLKMNVDEYLNLVSYLTTNIHGVSSLTYLKSLHKVEQAQYFVIQGIQRKEFETIVNDVKELKSCVNVRIPTHQNRIEELENDVVQLKHLSDDSLQKKLVDFNNIVSSMKKEIVELKQKFVLKKLVESNKKACKESNIIEDNIVFLDSKNILDECVAFHKTHSTLCNSNILSTIKIMLNTKKFVLSADFKTKKIDLHDISFEYKMLTKPDDITQEEILNIVFNNN